MPSPASSVTAGGDPVSGPHEGQRIQAGVDEPLHEGLNRLGDQGPALEDEQRAFAHQRLGEADRVSRS